MRVEYDPKRDLMYVWFAEKGTPAASTEVIRPGLHADFDSDGKLVGLELLEASQTVGDALSIELALPVTV
jgi:uncharacterized protein YuzE